MKTRFGDGFRATSAGMTRWTDGLVGGMDDAIARVHNQAYENFYCAGIEAYIGSQIADNATMQNHLLRIAEEDLLFAIKELENTERAKSRFSGSIRIKPQKVYIMRLLLGQLRWFIN